MICSICNGLVQWQLNRRGDFTHTECISCGATNCQITEDDVCSDNDDDEVPPNDQDNRRREAASG